MYEGSATAMETELPNTVVDATSLLQFESKNLSRKTNQLRNYRILKIQGLATRINWGKGE